MISKSLLSWETEVEERGFLRDSTLLFVANMSANFLLFLFHFSVARLLPPSEYGELVSLLAFIWIFSVPFRTVQTVTAEAIAGLRRDQQLARIWGTWRTNLLTVVPIGGICLALFTLGKRSISDFLAINSENAVVILGISVAISFFLPVNRGILQGIQRFRDLGLNILTEALFRLSFGVLLVFFGWGLDGALLSYGLGYVVAFLFAFVSLRPLLRDGGEGSRKSPDFIALINGYSLHVLVINACLMTMVNLDVLLVNHYFSSVESGTYAAASMFGKITLLTSAAVGGVMFPKIAALSTFSQKRIQLLKKGALFAGLSASALAIGFVLLPSLSISILLGPSYTAAGAYVGMFGLAMVVFSQINILVSYHLAMRSVKITLPVIAAVFIEGVLLSVFHSSLEQVLLALIGVMVGLLACLFLYTWWGEVKGHVERA
ncbi:MAG: oligosaccharide flippase family protein [Chloroflexi bacterium]|nr:oligosaccharide flippase family protein [Chloroflexota bacterium]